MPIFQSKISGANFDPSIFEFDTINNWWTIKDGGIDLSKLNQEQLSIIRTSILSYLPELKIRYTIFPFNVQVGSESTPVKISDSEYAMFYNDSGILKLVIFNIRDGTYVIYDSGMHISTYAINTIYNSKHNKLVTLVLDNSTNTYKFVLFDLDSNSFQSVDTTLSGNNYYRIGHTFYEQSNTDLIIIGLYRTHADYNNRYIYYRHLKLNLTNLAYDIGSDKLLIQDDADYTCDIHIPNVYFVEYNSKKYLVFPYENECASNYRGWILHNITDNITKRFGSLDYISGGIYYSDQFFFFKDNGLCYEFYKVYDPNNNTYVLRYGKFDLNSNDGTVITTGTTNYDYRIFVPSSTLDNTYVYYKDAVRRWDGGRYKVVINIPGFVLKTTSKVVDDGTLCYVLQDSEHTLLIEADISSIYTP